MTESNSEVSPAREQDMPIKDERAAAGDEGGIGGDAQGRDTDDRLLVDTEQRRPAFDSTLADPEPLPGDLDAPEGIESVGEGTRAMSEPADQFIEDLPMDPEDAEGAGPSE